MTHFSGRKTVPGALTCVLLVGLLLALLNPLRAETADAMALHTVVERYLAAFARRDQPEAFRWMTPEPDLNLHFWNTLTEELSAQKEVEIQASKFRLLSSDEEFAYGRIQIKWKTNDPKTGRPVEGNQTLDLSYTRVGQEWKLRGFRFAERFVYHSFVKAESTEARTRILDRNADLVDGWLPYALRDEANTLADDGKPEEAQRFNEMAFEVAEWMKSDYERAYCYLIRGYIHRRKLDWNPSLKANEQALDLFEKIGDKEGQAKVWRNCAYVYSTAANFDKAFKAFGLAIQFFREIKDDASVAVALQDLGVAQQYSGRPVEALQSAREALEIQRKLGNRRTEAILLGNIASAQQDLRQYGEALRGYEEARKIFKEINDFSAEGPILTNLGNLYQILGRPAESEQIQRAAVKLAREQKREEDELIALHNLTIFLLDHDRLDEAGETGMASAALASKLKNDRFMPQIWSNLGEIGIRLQAWKPARESYEEMLASARASGHRGMEALAIMSLGVVDHRERAVPDYQALAAKRYTEAAELAGKVGASAVLLRIRTHQGDLYRDMRDYARAAVHLSQAIELVEEVRALTEVTSLQTSYLRQHTPLYYKLAQCYILLGEPEKAFAVSEQFKARGLVDVIRSGKVRITRSMSPRERSEEIELEGRLAQLSATIEKTVLTDSLNQLTEERDKTRTQLEAFREKLYLQHPDLKTRRADFTPAAPGELAEKLLAPSPRSVLISYLVLDQETLLFVLHRDKRGTPRMALHRTPVTRRKLREAVEAHWQACSVSGGAYEGPAQELFRYLIAPAAPELAGKDHLILVPDIELTNLAFAALLDGQGRPLTTKYALSYAPSATALLRMTEMNDARPKPKDRVPLLAFGSPVFPTRMPELPASAAEVAAISRLFGRRGVTRTGEQALESAAHMLLGKARFVHFATHGTLDAAAPMFSSIVLTRDNQQDGYLQARELAEMDLSADLVVMSACETALGQKVRGEGILGLTWGLLAGGAASTMASQWQVADESTSALMTSFYRVLTDRKAPVSRAEALRRAQGALIQGKKYAHPYYWAPFVLLGQWENRS